MFFQEYCLMSTGDLTDRKEEIEKLLQRYGICVLGSGAYYVSGVQMPLGSTLMGLGECSELILLEEVVSGVTVSLGTRCTVKNLTVKGAAEDLPKPETMGTRHGIAFLGDSTPQNRGAQHQDGIISSCRIRSFSGGGITCLDTGYSVDSSLCISDCRIHGCGAGINISRFSEYHRFTNVVCTRNLYGCINNGGNNVFVGCSFDGNTEGYLIDNRENQSPNNAHGSCVGCTFNHTNSNKGVGIRILGSKPGYVFSACQIFFSEIVVEDSIGIQFDHINFGKEEKITVKGGGAVHFTGCMFTTPPVVSVEENPHVQLLKCCTKAGEPITL